MDTKRTLPRAAGTFSAVLDEYEASSKFTSTAPNTQGNYRRALRWAHDTLGQIPVEELRPALVQFALDQIADKPATQKIARAVLGTVEKWAIVREKLPRQIVLGTEVVGSDGGHEPWTDAQVALVERDARPDLARVVTLMVNTGQRGSDVVRMRLSDLEEQPNPLTGDLHQGINVVQQKTGLRLWVPFTDELTARVAEWRKDIRPPWLLVTKPNGQPFGRPNLSWAWNKERDTNPALVTISEAGLTLHGLRATCVVRLRKAGASVLQICSMVGMSEPMVSRYSRLADQRDMALAAVHRLNVRTVEQRQRSAEGRR